MKKIAELYKQDKPREKLISKGVEALKNEELMAVLIGSGVQGNDVRKLSKEIISVLNAGLDGVSLETLCDIRGLGTAKASQILSAIELSKRYLIRTHKRITDAKDVYEELQNYCNKKQEYFLSITLDGASHIINTRTVFIGTL
ncbi:MAG: hypothetical protein LGB55_06795, partial [Sulfurovum sp.]|nr:hypothetical protein [Sulfurovum sp.]